MYVGSDVDGSELFAWVGCIVTHFVRMKLAKPTGAFGQVTPWMNDGHRTRLLASYLRFLC